MKSGTHQIVIEVIVVGCLFLFSFMLLWPGMRQAAFHPDEAHKISESYFFDLILNRDVANPRWQDDFYARTNPPVGKYIMGAWLMLRGHHFDSSGLQDEFERLWQRPDKLLKAVPSPVLYSGRLLSMIFGVMCCLLTYALGRWAGGVATGVLSWVLLLFHPLFKDFCRLAMTDMILLTFMTMIVVVSITCMKLATAMSDSRQRPSKWQWLGAAFTCGALLPGIIIALAAGTKLNGALSGILFLIVAFIGFVMQRMMKEGRQLNGPPAGLFFCMAVLGAVLSVLFFIALNPYLYGNPVDKLMELSAVYKDWMQKQMISPGEPLFLWQQKVAAMGYYHFIQPFFFLPGWRSFFQSAPGLFFFMTGVVVMIWRMVKSLTLGQVPETESVLLAWLVVYGVGITAWIPVAWPRYFLPLCPMAALYTALGLTALCASAGRCIRRYRSGAVERVATVGHHYGLGRKMAVLTLAAAGVVVWLYTLLLASLPPTAIWDVGREKLEKLYEKGRSSRITAANSLFNRGDLMRLGQSDEKALKFYEQGRDMVEKSDISRIYEEKSIRIALQVAGIYNRLEKYSLAVEAMIDHLNGLRRVRDGLHSRDPKVLAAFDKLIRHKEDLLGELREKAGR